MATLLIVAYITLITRGDGLSRSFWGDEAWVARCILGDFEAVPSGSAQSTPVGYLAVTRGIVAMFGASETSFRILPLLSGVLAVAFMTLLGGQLFSRPLGLLGGLILALSASAAQYAKEGKQYSTELLVSVLLLLFLSRTGPARNWRSYVLRLSVLGLAALFSLPSLVFLPAAFAVDLLLLDEPTHRRHTAIGLCFVLAAALPAALVVRALPGLASMRAFWSGAFPDWSAGLESVARLYANLLKTFALSYLYPGWTAHSAGRLLVYVLLMAGLATLSLALFRRLEPRLCRTATIALVPLVGALAASLLGTYPFGVERLSLFLLPCLLLILLAGLAELPIPERWLAPAVALVALACLPLSLTPATWAPRVTEESRDALRDIVSRVSRGDLLYADNGLKQPLLVYTKWFPSADPQVYFGSDTILCCAPAVSLETHTESERRREVESFELFLASGTGRRLWLIHPTRASHWQFLGWSNIDLHRQILERRLCQRELEGGRPGVTYSAWRCPL